MKNEFNKYPRTATLRLIDVGVFFFLYSLFLVWTMVGVRTYLKCTLGRLVVDMIECIAIDSIEFG